MIKRNKDLYTVSDTIHLESTTPQLFGDNKHPGNALFFHEIAKKAKRSWRTFDFLVSFILIVFALPVAPLVWLLVRTTSNGPGFQRVRFTGFRGKPFNGYLFRTTRYRASGSITVIDNQHTCDIELTSAGRFLRRFCLDRMPLLLNILRGDMSLSGSTLYSEITANRLNNKIPWFYKSFAIKPGIFSLAEVNGYKTVEPDVRTGMIQSAYDISFALNRSTSRFLKIFFLGFLGLQDHMTNPVEATLLPEAEMQSSDTDSEQDSSILVSRLGS